MPTFHLLAWENENMFYKNELPMSSGNKNETCQKFLKGIFVETKSIYCQCKK